jgi:uncharacterized protein
MNNGFQFSVLGLPLPVYLKRFKDGLHKCLGWLGSLWDSAANRGLRTGNLTSVFALFFTIIGGMLIVDVSAKDIPARSTKLVNDYAGVLSNEEQQALEQKLVAYFDSTSTQIAVVIENSLEGDDLFDYSQRLATAWGIGEKGKNNGILIYAAIQDRQLRIHVGYGMEATITDALTSRVRTQHMNPYFKQGAYYAGFDEGTTIIMQAASGEYVNDRPKSGGKGKSPWVTVIIIVIVLVVFMSKGGRGGRGGGLAGPIFWGTLGSGGFSGGGRSSGGGGFGGFGGGGFGGGGSGGSW